MRNAARPAKSATMPRSALISARLSSVASTIANGSNSSKEFPMNARKLLLPSFIGAALLLFLPFAALSAKNPPDQSAAFAADSGFDPVSIAQNTVVVSLNLAAGNYVFTGKVVAGDTVAANTVVCSLFNGGGGGGPSILDISSTPNLTTGNYATLPLVGSLSLSGSATISIVCTAQSSSGTAFAQYAHLIAVRVSTLTP